MTSLSSVWIRDNGSRRSRGLPADCGLVAFAEKEPPLEDVLMTATKGLVT